jgi:hypothetical protein
VLVIEHIVPQEREAKVLQAIATDRIEIDKTGGDDAQR